MSSAATVLVKAGVPSADKAAENQIPAANPMPSQQATASAKALATTPPASDDGDYPAGTAGRAAALGV